jgi:hypothetical protein
LIFSYLRFNFLPFFHLTGWKNYGELTHAVRTKGMSPAQYRAHYYRELKQYFLIKPMFQYNIISLFFIPQDLA